MANEQGITYQHHPVYYIHSADAVFLVEGNLYRVHGYFLDLDSSKFKAMLSHPASPGQPRLGTSDENPVLLDDMTVSEFDLLLWVFYEPTYNLYQASLEDWIRLLKIGHKWDFIEVKDFAVRELQAFDIDPIQKICLYHENGVDQTLLIPSYIALSVREESLSFDEGEALGMKIVIRLGAARDRVRRNVNNSVSLNQGEMEAIVADIFQLGSMPAADGQPGGSVTTSTADDPLEGQGPGAGANVNGIPGDLDVHMESDFDDNRVNGVSALQEGTDATESVPTSKMNNGVSDPITGDGSGSSNDDNHSISLNSEPDMGQHPSNENNAIHLVEDVQTPSNNENIPNGVAHGSITGGDLNVRGGEGGSEMNGDDRDEDDASRDDDQSGDSDEATVTGEGAETDEVVKVTEVDEETGSENGGVFTNGTGDGESGTRNAHDLPSGHVPEPNGHVDLLHDGKLENGESGGGHDPDINGVGGSRWNEGSETKIKMVNGVESHGEDASMAAQTSGGETEGVANRDEGGSGLSDDHVVKEAEGIGGGGSVRSGDRGHINITVDTDLTFDGDDGDESADEFFDSSDELPFPELSLWS